MRTNYLIYSFTSLLIYFVLNHIENEFKWVALGFGGAMLLFGIFMKEKVKITKEEINNLNKKESVIKE